MLEVWKTKHDAPHFIRAISVCGIPEHKTRGKPDRGLERNKRWTKMFPCPSIRAKSHLVQRLNAMFFKTGDTVA